LRIQFNRVLDGSYVTFLLRVVLSVYFACFALVSAQAEGQVQTGPSLLFDAHTGEVISQERAGEPWYPASLTKLMTAYVIFKKIKEGKLALDQHVMISALAHSQPASHFGLPTGQFVTIDFALQGMLVYSANDMAYVLAEAGGNSVFRFAKEMNAIAHDMGLASTHFVNPNGLFDPRQITSARDIGIVAALLINQFPEHAHYFSQPSVAVGKRQLMNHNSLIRIMPEAVGMKTGFVCNSGYNLVGSAVKGGRQLVSVVLGAHSGGARASLSQLLLKAGLERIPDPQHVKVAEIVDQAYGAIVPADMSAAVCKGRPPTSQVDTHEMTGWAISFGTYDTLVKADMALRGRMIAPAGIDAVGRHGVIKMTGNTGFAAMLWNLDQATSLSLCAQYRVDGAPCYVMPDTTIKQIVMNAPREAPLPEAITDEGSDTDHARSVVITPKAKSGKTRVHKTLQ
jgi:D-alanyl-D-alanine carboxypeptidase